MYNNCELQKFFKRRQLDLLLFGYVVAVQKNMPTVSILSAVQQFILVFDVDEGVSQLQTLVMTFKRMKVELMEAEKNNKKQ